MRGGNEHALIEEPSALDLDSQALGDPGPLNLREDFRPQVFVPLCPICEGKVIKYSGVRTPSITRYATSQIPVTKDKVSSNGYAAPRMSPFK